MAQLFDIDLDAHEKRAELANQAVGDFRLESHLQTIQSLVTEAEAERQTAHEEEWQRELEGEASRAEKFENAIAETFATLSPRSRLHGHPGD